MMFVMTFIMPSCALLHTHHIFSVGGAIDITVFSIGDQPGEISGSEIVVTMPSGTDVTSLAPVINVPEGASISPASGVPQDFTNPVVYTITTSTGASKSYTVRIIVSAPSANEITLLSILGRVGTITGQDIVVALPYGTSTTLLVPFIVHTGASISPASGVVQDFTNPVTYTVSAVDGTTRDYTVTAVVAGSDELSLIHI